MTKFSFILPLSVLALTALICNAEENGAITQETNEKHNYDTESANMLLNGINSCNSDKPEDNDLFGVICLTNKCTSWCNNASELENEKECYERKKKLAECYYQCSISVYNANLYRFLH